MFNFNLRTERLILRKWRKRDVYDLYEYATSELVGPFAGWKPHKNIQDSKDIIKMFIKEPYNYAIVLKNENKVVGDITLHNRKPEGAPKNLKQREIGYVLNPKYWGNGIMPEAVNCLIEYSFDRLNLDLIWCVHYDFNNNSKRVIEKCGFKYKFTKPQRLELLDNKLINCLYYSISKNEYINSRVS